jgi:hypothetical protein
MRVGVGRFDAPFWVVLLAGVILVGSAGFLGLAAAAQDAAKSDGLLVFVGQT